MSKFYNCHIHDCQPKFYGDSVMIRSMICPECEKAVEENRRLRLALEEISTGAGPYSRDPLEHATDTIQAMKELALEALGGK